MNTIRTRPKFRKSKFFLLFGLAWLLFGVPLILFGIHEWNTNRRFENAATKTTGSVISKRKDERWDSKEKRTDTYYYVKYKFKNDLDAEIEQEQSLDSEAWGKIKENAPIEIEYLKDANEYNRIAGTASDFGSYITLIIGGIFCLLGGAFAAYDLKKRLHTAKILKNGIETIGSITRIEGSSLTINDVVQVNLLYTFKDRTGQTFDGVSNYLNPRLLKDVNVGTQCKIAYDKNDPTKNLLLCV